MSPHASPSPLPPAQAPPRPTPGEAAALARFAASLAVPLVLVALAGNALLSPHIDGASLSRPPPPSRASAALALLPAQAAVAVGWRRLSSSLAPRRRLPCAAALGCLFVLAAEGPTGLAVAAASALLAARGDALGAAASAAVLASAALFAPEDRAPGPPPRWPPPLRPPPLSLGLRAALRPHALRCALAAVDARDDRAARRAPPGPAATLAGALFPPLWPAGPVASPGAVASALERGPGGGGEGPAAEPPLVPFALPLPALAAAAALRRGPAGRLAASAAAAPAGGPPAPRGTATTPAATTAPLAFHARVASLTAGATATWRLAEAVARLALGAGAAPRPSAPTGRPGPSAVPTDVPPGGSVDPSDRGARAATVLVGLLGLPHLSVAPGAAGRSPSALWRGFHASWTDALRRAVPGPRRPGPGGAPAAAAAAAAAVAVSAAVHAGLADAGPALGPRATPRGAAQARGWVLLAAAWFLAASADGGLAAWARRRGGGRRRRRLAAALRHLVLVSSALPLCPGVATPPAAALAVLLAHVPGAAASAWLAD